MQKLDQITFTVETKKIYRADELLKVNITVENEQGIPITLTDKIIVKKIIKLRDGRFKYMCAAGTYQKRLSNGSYHVTTGVRSVSSYETENTLAE